MQLARPAFASDPRHFGRGPQKFHVFQDFELRVSDDLKLFATTFLGAFLFVSLLIA